MKDRALRNSSRAVECLPKLRTRAKLNVTQEKEKNSYCSILSKSKKNTIAESCVEIKQKLSTTKRKITLKSQQLDGKQSETEESDWKMWIPNETPELVVLKADKSDDTRKRERQQTEVEQSLAAKKMKYNHCADPFKACFRLQHSHLPYSDVPAEDVAGIYKIAYKWQTIYIGETPTSVRNRLSEHIAGTDDLEIGQFLSSLPVRDKQMNVTVFWLDKNTTFHSCPENNFLHCIKKIEGKKPKYNQSFISASTPTQQKWQNMIAKPLIQKGKETLNISDKSSSHVNNDKSQNGALLQPFDVCTNKPGAITNVAQKEEIKKSAIPVLKQNHKVDTSPSAMCSAKHTGTQVLKDTYARRSKQMVKITLDVDGNENILKVKPCDNNRNISTGAPHVDNHSGDPVCRRNSEKTVTNQVHPTYLDPSSSTHSSYQNTDHKGRRHTHNVNGDKTQKSVAELDVATSKRNPSEDDKRYCSILDNHRGNSISVPHWNTNYSDGTTSGKQNCFKGRPASDNKASSFWKDHMTHDDPVPQTQFCPTSAERPLVLNEKTYNDFVGSSSSNMDIDGSAGRTASGKTKTSFWIPRNDQKHQDVPEHKAHCSHTSADRQLVINDNTQTNNFGRSNTSDLNREVPAKTSFHAVRNTAKGLRSCNLTPHQTVSLQAQRFGSPKNPSRETAHQSPSLLHRPKDRNIWQCSQHWMRHHPSSGITGAPKERHFSDALIQGEDHRVLDKMSSGLILPEKTPSAPYPTDKTTCRRRLTGQTSGRPFPTKQTSWIECSTEQTAKSRLLGSTLYAPHTPPLPRAVMPRRRRNSKYS